ncbi:TrfB-related DNA-binding protein [Variovorax sp. LT1P1]|uniref:TrfB-related DNA-binding protein n=1 Tax=Variovorax sp. LT1P1 TaxID=3443730 RepID=UPI003F48C1C8
MGSDESSGSRVRAKATLTRDQFDAAIGRSKSLKARTIAIARGVLVDGRPQSDFVAAYGLSKSAVSQAVSRIAAYCDVPAGHVQITAVLPLHQADIVRGWASDASRAHAQAFQSRAAVPQPSTGRQVPPEATSTGP